MTPGAHRPFPHAVAVKMCGQCGRVQIARHVNREDRIAPRYCSRCGTRQGVALYTYERTLDELL